MKGSQMKTPDETDLPKKRFFRVDEVAQLLGFSKNTIRKWTREEKIAHLHFNGVIVIPFEEVAKMCRTGIPKRGV